MVVVYTLLGILMGVVALLSTVMMVVAVTDLFRLFYRTVFEAKSLFEELSYGEWEW